MIAVINFVIAKYLFPLRSFLLVVWGETAAKFRLSLLDNPSRPKFLMTVSLKGLSLILAHMVKEESENPSLISS